MVEVKSDACNDHRLQHWKALAWIFRPDQVAWVVLKLLHHLLAQNLGLDIEVPEEVSIGELGVKWHIHVL